MDKKINEKPHIICGLIFSISKDKINSDMLSSIKKLFVNIDIFDDCYEITTNKVQVSEWYLENVLDKLFLEFKEDKIREFIDIDECKVLLDIEIWKKDRYPSIIFSDSNMEKIRNLKADISIDMYG